MLNWRKLLFKLHLRNDYPIILSTPSGEMKIPANVLRTTKASSNIVPDMPPPLHINQSHLDLGVVDHGYDWPDQSTISVYHTDRKDK